MGRKRADSVPAMRRGPWGRASRGHRGRFPCVLAGRRRPGDPVVPQQPCRCSASSEPRASLYRDFQRRLRWTSGLMLSVREWATQSAISCPLSLPARPWERTPAEWPLCLHRSLNTPHPHVQRRQTSPGAEPSVGGRRVRLGPGHTVGSSWLLLPRLCLLLTAPLWAFHGYEGHGVSWKGSLVQCRWVS